MKTLKKYLSGCARLEERLFLWLAGITDAWADWVELRWGKLWFLVSVWKWKAGMFRWCASLDRRFINWLGK